jgi:hypothetical protein
MCLTMKQSGFVNRALRLGVTVYINEVYGLLGCTALYIRENLAF